MTNAQNAETLVQAFEDAGQGQVFNYFQNWSQLRRKPFWRRPPPLTLQKLPAL